MFGIHCDIHQKAIESVYFVPCKVYGVCCDWDMLEREMFQKITDGLQKLAAIEGIRLPNPRFSPKPKLSTFSFLKMILLPLLSTPPKKSTSGLIWKIHAWLRWHQPKYKEMLRPEHANPSNDVLTWNPLSDLTLNFCLSKFWCTPKLSSMNFNTCSPYIRPYWSFVSGTFQDHPLILCFLHKTESSTSQSQC